MLIEELLASMSPKVRITTEEIGKDLLGVLLQIEVNDLKGRPTEIWYPFGGSPTNAEAQRLLEGLGKKGPVSRANNGGLPF
jgi:hypothetical protein